MGDNWCGFGVAIEAILLNCSRVDLVGDLLGNQLRKNGLRADQVQ